VMLPSLSRALRAALVVGLSLAYIGWHAHAAFAKGAKGGDDSGDDGGDDEGDDEGGGGDKGGEGGDDEDPDDKDQPPITAGGLFTMNTFPVRENSRPLTMTQ